ncbi:electron transporter SenC [Zobellella endophytica]|uniref:Electron transporter SenC n=1 Tax=Zobellella endophytica TaxID=2116700 RepID=A0A2P7R637_9GAMM|nr:SCO family protein [Zobellella endophytica]PSJ45681.1 electron transporter SenC [Zobellella endophytica]
MERNPYSWCKGALLGLFCLLFVQGTTASPWGADYFPNTLLVNQHGEEVRFFDDLLKDKVVAINFIFTSCTDSCPLETARLKQVQDLLGDRVGRDIFFYSITIDPQTDTPEVLRQYAERFRVGPGWQFLTGAEQDIDRLRQKLGLFIEGVDDSPDNNHTITMIVGNQSTGRWMKASPFENPYILADRLGNSLHNWKQAVAMDNSYEEAPELRAPSTGEQLFRTRCSSCHTLGDNEHAGMRGIGPDLLGVTRNRDPAWLVRWIKEPDRMLEEKDPLALALYEQYNRVSMPNLRLNDSHVHALLAYIEEETERLMPAEPAPAPMDHSAHHQGDGGGHSDGHGDHQH